MSSVSNLCMSALTNYYSDTLIILAMLTLERFWSDFCYFVLGQVELVEVLQLAKGFFGYLSQMIPSKIQTKKITVKGCLSVLNQAIS